MSYLILSRKYRPQKFSDLVGQETIAKILQSAILQNRLASAYLFSGPRGTGKTTTARIFAKVLNCHKNRDSKYQVESCDACSSCHEIRKGISMDLLEIDAASHTQVDHIRQVVIDTVAFAPVRDRYKLFIIDEVHMLSNHSFNALLKTLEEPPPHVIFVLCTTEFHKIPATISSRCQRFRFLPLTQQEISLTLKKISEIERIQISPNAISLLAKSATGSMRDALSLLDQVISELPSEPLLKEKTTPSTSVVEKPSIDLEKVEKILGVVRENILLEFIQKIAQKDSRGVLESIGALLREGYDLSYFLKEVRESFRKMLIEKCGYNDANSTCRIESKLPIDQFSLEQLLRAAQLLTKCAEQMRWNDFPQMVFESFAVRLCQETVGAGELFEQIEKLEKGLKIQSQEKPPSERKINTKKDLEPLPSPLPSTQPLKVETLPPPFPTHSPYPTQQTSDPSFVPSNQNEIPTTTTVSPLNKPVTSAKMKDQNGLENSPNMKQLWKKILLEVQESKPLLFHALESASVHWNDKKMGLTFPKPFWMERVKKDSLFLENLIQKFLNKEIILTFKLEEVTLHPVDGETVTPNALLTNEENSFKLKTFDIFDLESESLVAETEPALFEESFKDLHENGENTQNDETFEVLDDSLVTTKELAVEDDGLKKFLHFFSGKLTRS